MNFFVADPEWGWWIILYFYLGGIAAGAYFLSSLIELVGGRLSRVRCCSRCHSRGDHSDRRLPLAAVARPRPKASGRVGRLRRT